MSDLRLIWDGPISDEPISYSTPHLTLPSTLSWQLAAPGVRASHARSPRAVQGNSDSHVMPRASPMLRRL